MTKSKIKLLKSDKKSNVLKILDYSLYSTKNNKD